MAEPDPKMRVTGSVVSRPEPVVVVPQARPAPVASPAENTFDRLMKYIGQFEAQLDQQHEVGGRFVSFGDTVQFHITNIGYWNPDIITFDGLDSNGNKMKLIQNVSQLNVLLVAMRKMAPVTEPPRRIGFDLGADDETAATAGKTEK